MVDYENKKELSKPKWYRSTAIHYPILFIVVFLMIRVGRSLPSNNVMFIFGMLVSISAISGIITERFYFKLRFISNYINDNNYALRANLIQFLIGVIISVITVFLQGFEVVTNVWIAIF